MRRNRHRLTIAMMITLLGVVPGITAAPPPPEQEALQALHRQCQERKRRIRDLQRRIRELERKNQAEDKAIENYRGVRKRNRTIIRQLENRK